MAWSHNSEEGKRKREWKEARIIKKGKKEKGGKGFWGIVGVFGFLFDCVFHSIPFCPPFSIHHATTLHHHALTHPTTVHTTQWHTQRATQPRVCVLWRLLFACRCLCVSLSARSFLTQPKPRHAIQSPYPPHMAPPMHEPMSEREGAAVCVDTTAQTPATTTKSRCHSHHLLSFLPSIGHPHSSHHSPNTTTPTLTPCDTTCPTPTRLLTLQQHMVRSTHDCSSHTREGRAHVADINCC